MSHNCYNYKLSNYQTFVELRAMKAVIFITLAIFLVAGFFLWPRTVIQAAQGKTQAGVEYRATCTSSPESLLSIGNLGYHVKKMELTLNGSSRNVPSAALENCGSIDTKRQPQVFEEGPVLVVTTFTEEGGTIQWRFLNGQFAQRRTLKGAQQDVRNFQDAIDRPSIIGPPPQGSARTLQSPSILSSPDNSVPTVGNR